MKQTRIGALLLALAMMVGLMSGCARQETEPTTAPSTQPVESTQPSQAPVTADRPQVNLAMLSGPTGMGAAKLMSDNTDGLTRNDYTVTVAAQPTDLTGKLTNGELDIAALPTNVAAALYNKTGGAIQMLALNTLGVLYILENGDSIHSMADLRGKTVYATGQGANPEYVFNDLLRANGLEPGTDVTIEWKATGEEVSALMLSGEAQVALLPVPAATSVLMQNSDVRAAIDLNDAWTDAGQEGTMTMGCVVVRTAFAQENPQAVENFLQEYQQSIEYVRDHPDEAAALVVEAGIVPKEPIAKAAIPQANLVCITGSDMLSIQDYYRVLWDADPSSIGGTIPDDAFYYVAP